MKKSFLILSVLSAFFALFMMSLVACSDGGDSSNNEKAEISDKNTKDGSSNMTEVNILATSNGGVVKFGESSRASRTILPGDLGGTSCNYFLATTNKTTGAIAITSVTFTPDAADNTKGTVTTTLAVDSYKMELYALLSTNTYAVPTTTPLTSTDIDNLRKEAVLSAVSFSDLRYNKTVVFYLTANNLSGDGHINITIQAAPTFDVPDTTNDYEITAGLYNSKGDLIFPVGVGGAQGTPLSLTQTGNAAPHTFDATGGANVLDGTNTDIPSGTYDVKVIFTVKATPTIKYVYSESVIVMANTTSTATVIVPDILDKLPNPPADFIAGRTPPTDESYANYTVEFAWTDTSSTETGYEIELMRVDNVTPGTDDFFKMPVRDAAATPTAANDSWAELKGVYATVATKIFDSDYYADTTANPAHKVTDGTDAWVTDIDTVSILTLNSKNLSAFRASMAGNNNDTAPDNDNGSLDSNSQFVKVLLPLEHRFLARIRSVNGAGASAWVYLKLPTVTPPATLATHATIAKGAAFGINGATTGYTSDLATEQHTLTTTSFPTDSEGINLYRIKYETQGGTYKDKNGTALAIEPVMYRSQSSNGAGAVSTTAVKILTPDSVAKDTAGGISSSIDRESNKKEDVDGLAADSVIELKSSEGSWWQGWKIGSINGDDYPATARGTAISAPDPDIPDIYTGYANLYLFASYGTGGNSAFTPSIVLENPKKFEIKPGFVKMTAYDDSNKTNKRTITDIATGDYLPDSPTTPKTLGITIKTGDANRAQYMEVQLDSAKTESTLSGGGKVALLYDSAIVRIVQVQGGNAVYYQSKQGTAGQSGDAGCYAPFKIDLSGYSAGKYSVIISATKGANTYSLTQMIELFN